MFTALEISNHNTANTQRNFDRRNPRIWLLSCFKNRRFISQLICRLPVLIVWSIIVIFTLYKLTSNPSDEFHPSDEGNLNLKATSDFPVNPPDHHLSQALTRDIYDLTDTNEYSTHATNFAAKVIKEQGPKAKSDQFIDIYNKKLKSTSTIHPLDTTTKESVTEYARSSKVFILIVQDDHRPSSRRPQSSPGEYNDRQAGSQLAVPAHIRLLIDILESHRISYAIDTTRNGLPAALLNDQNGTKDLKQFSVIVIDDFNKYTKLNRWLRDQLDRHCRANEIGVITYLTSELTEHDLRQASSPTTRQIFNGSSNTNKARREVQQPSTEISLADQFPLKFKSIDQRKSCSNSSNLSNMCLVDYQLNERSPILRVLKRKQNFILNGPLIENLNNSPWISMSSNHITYQPITWARAAQVEAKEDNDDDKQRIGAFAEPGSQHQRTRLQRVSTEPNWSTQNQHHVGGSRLESADIVRFASHQHGRTLENESVSLGADPSALASDSLASVGSAYNLLSLNNKPDARIQSSDSEQHEKSSSTHQNVLSSIDSVSSSEGLDTENIYESIEVLTMLDRGLYDGIRRVIFGGANHHWLNRILLLDAIEHLSSGQILSPLDRYIQIDIDDIFVGEQGKRMNVQDVEVLISEQQKFAQLIDGGFKFNLGFSGKYYKHGTESENLGDELLIEKADNFDWFCHFWSHAKAHLYNHTQGIANELRKNLEFANEHKLPIIGHGPNSLHDYIAKGAPLPATYAIAPHHSGVYPIHEQLYEAWRTILNVQVTSTEEYPHLRPASKRHGFVHKTIKVLPRQTCGLYTHTIYRDKYPGGIDKLEASIQGGELFETILHNQVNIYMTHMSNYGNDRLALDTFSALIDFVQSHTNLQLKFAPSSYHSLGPNKLADYYFNLHPLDKSPLWSNPCEDKRHLAIWSQYKLHYCPLAPKLLIIGPQKTGTTALYTFLKLNPQFKSSRLSTTDYEEIQFFNDKHYFEGIDWYFKRFENVTSPSDESQDAGSRYYFDKSATYFDDPKVPMRAKALLPDAKIIIMLIDPVVRAYSWYQHQRAHNDPIASSLTFEQLIMNPIGVGEGDEGQVAANKSASLRLALRNRCLHPGYYAQHLMSWLDHYPSRQVIIIDGEWFKRNPISVMNRLQLMLRADEPIDYRKQLVFDEQKGFYCQFEEKTGQSKCLGSGKGRKYEPISHEARTYLNRHYLLHNKQLARILTDIGQPLPNWLDQIMGITHSSAPRFRRNYYYN